MTKLSKDACFTALALALLFLFLPFNVSGADMPRPYTLMVGDAAPALGISGWIRGPEIKGFEKGTVHVIEFWATWCGPCQESIPHLSELAKKYGERLRVVGVDVWENAPEKVPDFVVKMGDRMAYGVARDLVPPFPPDVKSKSRFALENGRSSQDWLAASGWEENGIPVAFILDRDGRIAWIGEPLGGALDEPLAKVIDGSWDSSAYAREYAARAVVDKKIRALTRQMNTSFSAKDYASAVARAEELMALDPAQGHLAGFKFEVLLANVKDREAAYRYARAELPVNAFYQALSQMAWVIVFEDGRNLPEDLELAQALAERADILSDRTRPGIYNTLARISFIRNDFIRAVELQTKAVELSKTDDDRAGFAKTLEEYKRQKS